MGFDALVVARGTAGVEFLSEDEARRQGRCRLCRSALPAAKRSWCGPRCEEEFGIRTGRSEVVRQYLKRRDREVCESCGLDCRLLARVLCRLVWLSLYPRDRTDYWLPRDVLVRMGWSEVTAETWTDLWQADHRVPVFRGGTNAPDNYRTLCVPCHAFATAVQAAQRGAARRAQREAAIIGPATPLSRAAPPAPSPDDTRGSRRVLPCGPCRASRPRSTCRRRVA